MSPQERRFFELARRRLTNMEPEMRSVLLRAFEIIRESLSDTELQRIVEAGDVDLLFRRAMSEAVLERAMLPVRDRIRRQMQRGFQYAVTDLPRGGTINGVLAVAFDHLSPNVVTAIRTMESTAIDSLKSDIRDTVRAHVENGLRDGRAPKIVARELRSVIGLAPNQEQYIRNLRGQLETGQYADAASRKLMDQRFNLAKLDGMNPADKAERIDLIVDSYRKRMVAHSANVNAKTITFDAYKQGQALSWQDAKAKGVIPDGFRATKTWVHLPGQKDPRPTHEAMDGETVAADQSYSNGDSYAGQGDPYGCHCLDRFGIARVA